MSFETLGLSTELLRALAEQGYSTPTPIQGQAIPVVLAGSDLLAAAQTGTGKTAGFTLPLLQRLMATANEGNRRQIRALVIVPTRELAAQVQESVEDYSRHLPLKSLAIFGGVSMRGQINRIRRGIDVLVATPGRLLDHVGQGTIDLSHIEMLVLDEADRMLDMGFIRDIRRIISLLPETRQNLLFSATFSPEIKKLANSFLNSPELVEVSRSGTTAEHIEQSVIVVEQQRKRELLSYLIGSRNWQQVLVFTRTKHGANRLCSQLEKDGITAAAIHGNKSQGARTRALSRFKQNEVRVLVATDIAARGLDIDQLPHVINYELPAVAEDYVHRIGRTGRAGRDGEALSLVCRDEAKALRDIERLLQREIPRQTIDGFETEVLPASPKTRSRPKSKPKGRSQNDTSKRRNRPRRRNTNPESGGASSGASRSRRRRSRRSQQRASG